MKQEIYLKNSSGAWELFDINDESAQISRGIRLTKINFNLQPGYYFNFTDSTRRNYLPPRIGNNVTIGNSFIDNGVTIGDNSVIGDRGFIAFNTVIGKSFKMGNVCGISPFCKVGDNVTMGNYAELEPNTVISNGTILPNGDSFPRLCYKVLPNGERFIIPCYNWLSLEPKGY